MAANKFVTLPENSHWYSRLVVRCEGRVDVSSRETVTSGYVAINKF